MHLYEKPYLFPSSFSVVDEEGNACSFIVGHIPLSNARLLGNQLIVPNRRRIRYITHLGV